MRDFNNYTDWFQKIVCSQLISLSPSLASLFALSKGITACSEVIKSDNGYFLFTASIVFRGSKMLLYMMVRSDFVTEEHHALISLIKKCEIFVPSWHDLICNHQLEF